ncbi:Com family DNA-binding transcriptional regulator [Zhongshania sp.]|jgi:phage FluMu protein Com|uniref:Com family DNA-binding transcriptional regulator n=1 Tax=Zhongshania sp. TaxID=1971902 RepID=UPI0039C738D2
MQEIRCSRCNRLLAKAIYTVIEAKCPRCKFFNNMSAQSATEGARHVQNTQSRLSSGVSRDGIK